MPKEMMDYRIVRVFLFRDSNVRSGPAQGVTYTGEMVEISREREWR